MNKIYLAILAIVVLSPPSPGLGQLEQSRDWLTPEENAWLDDHPVIRVAPTPDYPPFEFWEKNRRTDKYVFKGIVNNYLQHFERELGIKFDLVRTSSWDENLKKLKSRKIEPRLIKSTRSAGARFCGFTHAGSSKESDRIGIGSCPPSNIIVVANFVIGY